MDLAALREKHPIFTYHSYHYEVTAEGLQLTFRFSNDSDHFFSPRVVLKGITQADIESIPAAQLEELVFHLGLIEIPSYWKATCSPLIKIEAGPLSPAQLTWWKKLLLKGLGEFFYRNEIDFTGDDFLTLSSSAAPTTSALDRDTRVTPPAASHQSKAPQTPSVLVPLGGGKDSIVTLELLKKSPLSVIPFALNPIQAVTELLKLNPDLSPIIAQRTIDPALLELNRQGYLNGHTPFSAYLAFLTYMVATLKGIPQIALSNERSANEGNVEYLGTVVNHQYSKSLEFENDFRDYVAHWLKTADAVAPEYFSLLRPLHELQIGRLFATLTTNEPQLRTIFRSCNRGQKTNSWCGECAKCLFAWLMLFPFLGETQLIEIFGQNLFEKESLLEEALGLIHPERVKPWECVGTRDESQVAFYLSLKMYEEAGEPLPLLLERVKPDVAHLTSQAAQRLLADWNEAHNLPATFETLLKNVVHSVEAATVKADTVVIFGLGREGLSTYYFLRQQLPAQTLTLVDEKPLTELDEEWKNILGNDLKLRYSQSPSAVNPARIVFRSAGIPRAKVEQLFPGAEVSSNTQLCFEIALELKAGGYPLTLIGITGTKGKSTTSAAIYHVLKENGVNAFLGGNIGKPPLEVLHEALATNVDAQPTYLVLELSSHQLSDLPYSPQIAVIQDVLPEHLDYYADFEEYWTAKSQIARHQTVDDTILYNEESKAATKIAHLSAGSHRGFGPHSQPRLTDIVALAELKVVGEHNYLNLLPSILIGQQVGLTTDQIAVALKSFVPLPHRLEKVAEVNGVTFINDSLATNPHATIAALKAFTQVNGLIGTQENRIILIAGGYDRGLDYSDLGPAIVKHNVKALVLFKPTGEKIEEAVKAAGFQTNRPIIQYVETMAEAVAQAWHNATPGDIVLMSPASASFGVFKDYADRGEQFREEANKIG